MSFLTYVTERRMEKAVCLLRDRDGRSNQNSQLEQIDYLLSRNCDVLCANIVDRTATADVLDAIREGTMRQ